ncbi:MAG: winged helix DNA-binding domain-containing protein [Anaerolineales bacterium]|nr:winged helix DNA-binding domain-containing protein [Anaerolineales bacterium]
MLNIDLQTARRFVLGKHGLWPGRRWQGAAGTQKAMRAMEYLQLDPLQIIARSHDIKLHARVQGYKPGLWEQAAYKQRKFFDWGGWLAVRPMDELPYWRVVMRREKKGHTGVSQLGREHAAAIKEMRGVLRERGTVSNRDFEMASRTRTSSYRGRKDSALALYYLWRTGEVMTHHRENFERVYALTEAVAPADLIREAGEAETDRFLVRKEVSHNGLTWLKRTAEAYYRGVPFNTIGNLREKLVADLEIIEVQVEGWKQVQCALASDAKALKELAAGRVPKIWKPLSASTLDEVSFLAPLDPVSARGRAKELFGFEYVWEVYKPEHLRKYGYYTLPILWGDQLVARFDSKLDRTTNTYIILGFWLEDKSLARNEAFAEALAAGFESFVRFLGAGTFNAKAVKEPMLRKRLAQVKP